MKSLYNNAMHTNSAVTFRLYIGDYRRGVGDGNRWADGQVM